VHHTGGGHYFSVLPQGHVNVIAAMNERIPRSMGQNRPVQLFVGQLLPACVGMVAFSGGEQVTPGLCVIFSVVLMVIGGMTLKSC
jgi:hypothetical protein